jgi:hypothetical protein
VAPGTEYVALQGVHQPFRIRKSSVHNVEMIPGELYSSNTPFKSTIRARIAIFELGKHENWCLALPDRYLLLKNIAPANTTKPAV